MAPLGCIADLLPATEVRKLCTVADLILLDMGNAHNGAVYVSAIIPGKYAGQITTNQVLPMSGLLVVPLQVTVRA